MIIREFELNVAEAVNIAFFKNLWKIGSIDDCVDHMSRIGVDIDHNEAITMDFLRSCKDSEECDD